MDFISAICYLVLTIGIIVIGLAILTFLFYEKRYGIKIINCTNSEIELEICTRKSNHREVKHLQPRDRSILEIPTGIIRFLRFRAQDERWARIKTEEHVAVFSLFGSYTPIANNIFWIKDDGIYLNKQLHEIWESLSTVGGRNNMLPPVITII